MGVERAARWPGAHRTSFWGAGGGSDADRPPLGGSPFHVAAAPSAPGLLVSRGLEPPSLALALQAVGGLCAPPCACSSPVPGRGPTRTEPSPHAAPSRPDEVLVFGAPPPTRSAQPRSWGSKRSAWGLVSFPACPQASGVTGECRGVCRARPRPTRPRRRAIAFTVSLQASRLRLAAPIHRLTPGLWWSHHSASGHSLSQVPPVAPSASKAA